MTPKLPRVTADRAARILERHGFSIVRQSGSHRIYRNAAGIRVTLPMHAGRALHPRIVRNIIDDTGIAAEEF
ncbi:MAG TPA: type II toxin-antitoxin system HicA family toxin [Candidatus Thermoplasmatota archaeon]|nr:type II toxin-antitoxin system HicA family toxin [Candidatus Thermoplasmatota archaeon]